MTCNESESVPTSWGTLVHLCRHGPERSSDLFESLTDDALRLVIRLAGRHHLLPLVSEVIARSARKVERSIERASLELLSWNQARTALVVRKVSELCRQVSDAAIPLAVTKGVSLAYSVYEGTGTRWFSDIDVMILPSDAEELDRLLDRLGCPRGDVYLGVSRPLSRREEAVYVLSPDHLPRRVLPIGELGLPALSIDVALSMTWASSPWNVQLEEVFQDLTTVQTPHGPLPCLPPYGAFLFVILHLFREAWFENTRSAITLAQFRDVVMLWHRLSPADLEQFVNLVVSSELNSPVSWVFGHTEKIFGPLGFTDTGFTASAAWLRSGSTRDGKAAEWAGDVQSVLQASDGHSH